MWSRISLHLIWKVLVLLVHILNLASSQKGKATEYLEVVSDLKQLKNLLRTKSNVMVLYSNGDESSEVRRWLQICNEAAWRVYGQATLLLVNCNSKQPGGGDERKKMCKKMKASPQPVALKHYLNGEFTKDYDRQATTESLVRFLKDPAGEIPWEEESDSGDVLHLQDPASLAKLLKKEKLPTLIMFYAPWCGHCKKMKPEFASAASELKGRNVLAAMDVVRPENEPVARHFNISGFPTLLYFESGQLKLPFNGHSKQEIIAWLNNPHEPAPSAPEIAWSETESDVTHLADASFHEFVQQHQSVLVMFYAPWCQHCKRLEPEFTEAARQLKLLNSEGQLAAVDATLHKSVAAEFSIQKYPTLKYFKEGQFAWNVDLHDQPSLVRFMQSPSEPSPAAPAEKSWSEEEPDLLHLSDSNFKSELKRKKHALVIFYAPWCGHCKRAKPEFRKAALEFVEDSKVAFGAVDCTDPESASTCGQFEVRGFPTFKYFSYLKSAEDYAGERTSAAFVEFIAMKTSADGRVDVKKAQADTAQPPDTRPPDDAFESAHVRRLGAHNFDSVLADSAQALLMFYAPWCGHCQNAKPEYSRAAELLHARSGDDPKLVIGAVDCVDHKALCQTHGIRSYPTFKLYSAGKESGAYTGERSAQAFLDGLDSTTQTTPEQHHAPAGFFDSAHVQLLTADSFQTAIANAERALVMFFAPWCGHCQSAKAEYSQAADSLHGSADGSNRVIGAVDCVAEKELCQQQGISGYPTFHLFEKGQFKQQHQSRQKQAFLDAVLPSSSKQEL